MSITLPAAVAVLLLTQTSRPPVNIVPVGLAQKKGGEVDPIVGPTRERRTEAPRRTRSVARKRRGAGAANVAAELRDLIARGEVKCTPTPVSVSPGPVVRNSIGMELVLIPSGKLCMGSVGVMFERPMHPVRIGYSFYMGKYEVTQAQWQAVMGANPSRFKGENNPVEGMEWEGAQEFIKKLNARDDDFAYRLPTEAEWEYACRAGTVVDYAGDLDAMAWYEKNSGKQVHPVGEKRPNAFGLYDMHGNVSELCLDSYSNRYEGAPADGSALTDGEPGMHVLRGCSWDSPAEVCRSAFRSADYWDGDIEKPFAGVRLVAIRRKNGSAERRLERGPTPALGLTDK